MLTPTEAIAIAPAISPTPAISPEPAGLSAQRPPLFGNPLIHPPGTPESTQHGSHWLSPGYTRTYVHTSTQKGWVSPKLERVVTPPSDLPETSASPTRVAAVFTRMFHTPQTIIARLFQTPQASLPDSLPLICVLPTRHTPRFGKANLRRSCAPSDYHSLHQLCTQERGRTSI